MKSVLISIKPKWCGLIASGKKTVEVRKTRPKIETPFKCYIYSTLDGGVKGDVLMKDGRASKVVCGMVIGEFLLDDLLEIENLGSSFRVKGDKDGFLTNMTATASCLCFSDMKAYLGEKNGWGWGISKLKIYDKPRELSEFRQPCKNSYLLCFCCDRSITSDDGYVSCNCKISRPPQSYMFVEELQDV